MARTTETERQLVLPDGRIATIAPGCEGTADIHGSIDGSGYSVVLYLLDERVLLARAVGLAEAHTLAVCGALGDLTGFEPVELRMVAHRGWPRADVDLGPVSTD